jgi:molybdopterin/thiamine biosynthesis adenylyltransferase/rhodanese-related sulfurtransferase
VSDELTPEELKRYNRHLILDDVGVEGQTRLKRASVLLVGTGGLGAPAALYLAAAGVGRLGLVDFDTVDVTNLQRQIIFGTSDAGRPKTDAAARRLADLNPALDIVTHDTRLTAANAIEILEGYDVVIDGSDNFATKYLVNDACVLLGKPDVYGSVLRFEGQAAVFGPEGPCYRCLYPEPPPPGAVPSCADAGVLGVLPGIVGSIQATEAIKLILGRGKTLAGRLLLLDALDMSFRTLEVPPNLDCPMCGPAPSITELIDYDEFCGTGGVDAESGAEIPGIDPAELKACLDASSVTLLDVREPYERDICNIGGDFIPISQIPAVIDRLDRNADIVVYCHHGIRSAYVVRYLLENGFDTVRNLNGGIHAWARDVDPEFPRY